MASFFRDNDDLRWYFDKGIEWEPIVRATELGFRRSDGFKDVAEALAAYRDILELVGELAAEEVAPHAAEIDRGGVAHVDGEAVFPPRLRGIFERIQSLDLHGLNLPRELG